MKRPPRPARALFVVMPFTIFLTIYFIGWTLRKYIKIYKVLSGPREEYSRMQCFLFIPSPNGLTAYQFNFIISNNFFICWLSFCCKALLMVWLAYTTEFAEVSTLMILIHPISISLPSFWHNKLHNIMHHMIDGLWSVKKWKHPDAHGVPNESFTVGFFMVLPYLKETFYLPFYFQHMQWRPWIVLNFAFACHQHSQQFIKSHGRGYSDAGNCPAWIGRSKCNKPWTFKSTQKAIHFQTCYFFCRIVASEKQLLTPVLRFNNCQATKVVPLLASSLWFPASLSFSCASFLKRQLASYHWVLGKVHTSQLGGGGGGGGR